MYVWGCLSWGTMQYIFSFDFAVASGSCDQVLLILLVVLVDGRLG